MEKQSDRHTAPDRPEEAGGVAPRLSVVIPTMGRALLLETLHSLLEVKPAVSLEVLLVGKVADPEVARPLAALLARHPARLRHLPVEWASGDSSRKKNAGAARARADIIAFLDDDVIVEPDWSERLTAVFGDPRVGLAGGPSLVPEELNLMGRLVGLAMASRAAGYVAERYARGRPAPRPVRWSRIIGCNMVFRRAALEAVGGFDPDFWPGEELLAAFRVQQAGYRILFDPGAGLRHYPRQSLRSFCRQIYGYGATRIRLWRAGVEVEWTTLAPAALVFFLAAATAAAPWWPPARIFLMAGILCYAAADLAVTLESFVRARRPDALLLFLLIPVMHIAYGVAQWKEFLLPNVDLGHRRS